MFKIQQAQRALEAAKNKLTVDEREYSSAQSAYESTQRELNEAKRLSDAAAQSFFLLKARVQNADNPTDKRIFEIAKDQFADRGSNYMIAEGRSNSAKARMNSAKARMDSTKREVDSSEKAVQIAATEAKSSF